jgi:hypothetical protein
MATNKRLNNNYTITTLNSGGEIALATSNVTIAGNVSATGNIVTNLSTASFFIGDGGFLSNINVSNASVVSTRIANGTSNISIPVASGNITFGVTTTGNVIVVSTQGANITTGTASTSNVTGALKVTGGVGVRGNVYADALYSNNVVVLNANSAINGGTY